MEVTLSALSLQLPPGGTMRLDAARGVTVRVHDGRLWLTEQGLPEDVILGPGECWRLRAEGRVVVQADSASRFELARPHARWRIGPRERIAAFGAALRGLFARHRHGRGWMPVPRPSALLP